VKVAVVGGGIFGCTAAIILADAGHQITLFEKEERLLTQTSRKNQLRLHRGYHYPRSPETVAELRQSLPEFTDFYHDVTYRAKQHIYAIAEEDSLVDPGEYLKFCDENRLPYEIIKDSPYLTDRIALAIKADESLIDSYALYRLVIQKLTARADKIMLRPETKFTAEQIDQYDLIVNATYSNLNELTPHEQQLEYQYEFCEKITGDVPRSLSKMSIVVMDGPFCCIDPLDGSSWHSLLGNVTYAVRATEIGKVMSPALRYEYLIANAATLDFRMISMFDAFIESGRRYIRDFEKIKYVTSSFTHRVVLPHIDATDARPTLLRWVSPKIVNIFSGKIDTCVRVANTLVSEIK
jgi:hypothetical protein